jgi:outer membrane lipoprotein
MSRKYGNWFGKAGGGSLGVAVGFVAKLDAGRCFRGFLAGAGLMVLLSSTVGCTSAISKQVRSEATVDLSLREVLVRPERYEGKVVIWSGTVLEAKNTPEGTLLKVLQKPADFQDKPKYTDVSEGRFLAIDRRYLDPAIYSQGRAVTVAGKIVGKQAMPQGDIQYTYPILEVKDLHLWPERNPDTNFADPYYYGYPVIYSRWWWRHPWW